MIRITNWEISESVDWTARVMLGEMHKDWELNPSNPAPIKTEIRLTFVSSKDEPLRSKLHNLLMEIFRAQEKDGVSLPALSPPGGEK